MSSSRGSSPPQDGPSVSCIADGLYHTTEPPKEKKNSLPDSPNGLGSGCIVTPATERGDWRQRGYGVYTGSQGWTRTQTQATWLGAQKGRGGRFYSSLVSVSGVREKGCFLGFAFCFGLRSGRKDPSSPLTSHTHKGGWASGRECCPRFPCPVTPGQPRCSLPHDPRAASRSPCLSSPICTSGLGSQFLSPTAATPTLTSGS